MNIFVILSFYNYAHSIFIYLDFKNTFKFGFIIFEICISFFLCLLLDSPCFVSTMYSTFLKLDFEELIIDEYKCNKCNKLFYMDLTSSKFLN